jgi:hypothetical protein
LELFDIITDPANLFADFEGVPDARQERECCRQSRLGRVRG